SGLSAFAKGFVTMAALIMAIGVQNAFVLRQGLKREAVFTAATICFFGDMLMVVLGTAGLGALFAASPVLSLVIAFGGAAFLLYYGIRSLIAAKHAKGLDLGSAAKVSRASVALTAAAVSFLNPHAILDTVVLIGGLAGRYAEPARSLCALGAITASALWFYGIAYGARGLAPVLTKPKIWRLIDLIIGIMMLSLAFGLARDGLKQFHMYF
ncbi:MAG: LysE/ArgO family amino acid transporter, partial [Bdellovibrionales bacterium]